MAAEVMAKAGLKVSVAEGKPTVGRKFLMAGKSGLNLTKDEATAEFLHAYSEAEAWLRPMIAAFGPEEVQNWARGLGQEVFTGSSGRVFPKAMKASPLLRAWLARLDGLGVDMRRRWELHDLAGTRARFKTPEGAVEFDADVVVLAMGGASWARLGSDGTWTNWLTGSAPFQPANVGLRVTWSSHMAAHLGQAIKGIALQAGTYRSRGEMTISKHGLEGGGIYSVSRGVREGHTLTVDLFPDLTEPEISRRLERPRGKASMSNHLRKVLRQDGARKALVQEWLRPLPDVPLLAGAMKSLPVTVEGLRPMDEAISTSGGVTRSQVDEALMLNTRPGVFVAGEMLDWEAPTGGYLLTGCFATGRWAGDQAARYLATKGSGT